MFPRRNRKPLGQPQPEGEVEQYPVIRVSLGGHPSADNTHDISVLDINTAGMGIACSVALSVGQMVFFTNDQPEWNLPKLGIVMWTFQNNDGFRAGIKFA
ncbi:MAG: hypothetical protein M0Z90_03095 [Desulfobacteraceae bacterium]|nr:hypothetical protein [Desulfobacteraceae bacterium]